MKLLLTSAGIKNASIHDALVELLGKPTAECDALCIPTALYGHPGAGPRQAWRCISGQETGTPTVGLGWKSMGVLELTALPSLDASAGSRSSERWTCCSSRAAMRRTSATGCGRADWLTSCRRCPTRSGSG